MKGNAVFKRACNNCLRHLGGLPVGAALGTEAALARKLEVSRTTVRAVLAALTAQGLVAALPGGRRLVRLPQAGDYFPEPETESVGEVVERHFLEWVLRGDFRSGQLINCSELARQSATSTTVIREFLNRFSHFGLVERRPNSAWMFKGLTREFAQELYEIREMFELRAAMGFAELPADAPAWMELAAIEAEHRALLADFDRRFLDFSRLDDRLHRLIYTAARNRFILDFYAVISMIFHYHYQWNKADEKERNRTALHEHLAYIAALRGRDRQEIEASCRTHLASARQTLLRSIG